MTRKEIESDYCVEGDTICAPCVFETAHISTPHFYDLVLNGSSERIGPGEDLIEVDDNDRAEFSLAPDDQWALVRSDSQGFVDVHFFAKRPDEEVT